ncbi:MAG: phospholipase D-like domain-containing protein, partial [Vulcanococcus sp.]
MLQRPAFSSLLTLACLLQGCGSAGQLIGAERAPELEQHPQIRAAFNHREDRGYISPISRQWRAGEDLEALLIEAIRSAESEVLVAVQELSLPAIARALAEQHRRGIPVKVVLENLYSQPWSSQHEAEFSPHQRQRHRQLRALADQNGDGQVSESERQQGDAVGILQRAGVPLLDDTADGSKGSGLMHSKYLVVDGQTVVTGSANFTASGLHGDPGAPRTRGNANHLLQIESPALAALFREDFERMWGDGPGGQPDSRFGLRKGQHAPQRIRVGSSEVEVLFAPHRRSDP